MSYVPVVVPPSPPSPRTRELADLLVRVIEAYEEGHPTTTRIEVREATRLALSKTDPSGLRAPIVAVALGGVMAMLLGAFVFLKQSGGMADVPVALPAVGIVALIVVLAVVAVARQR